VDGRAHRPRAHGRMLAPIWIGSTAVAGLLSVRGLPPVLECRGMVSEIPRSPSRPWRLAAWLAFALAFAALGYADRFAGGGPAPTLLAPYGRRLALVGTGVLFGLADGLLIDLPVLVVFGIAVGWVRVRTSSVYPGMLLLGTFDGVALLASVVVAH